MSHVSPVLQVRKAGEGEEEEEEEEKEEEEEEEEGEEGESIISMAVLKHQFLKQDLPQLSSQASFLKSSLMFSFKRFALRRTGCLQCDSLPRVSG